MNSVIVQARNNDTHILVFLTNIFSGLSPIELL